MTRKLPRRFAEAAARRWKLELGLSLQAVEDNGDGRVTAVFDDGDGKQLRLETDIVLMATGRVPNTDRLDVDAAGFDLTR